VLDSASAYETLELCRQHNIKVLARNGLMEGLVSSKYLGAPCPDTLQQDADLDNVLRAADTIKRCGGWAQVQQLLESFQQVADRHAVKLQVIMADGWHLRGTSFNTRGCSVLCKSRESACQSSPALLHKLHSHVSFEVSTGITCSGTHAHKMWLCCGTSMASGRGTSASPSHRHCPSQAGRLPSVSAPCS
jgi:hypothetical protein